ncbi:MAG: hypothetical protein DI527_20885 [Chelatococcus sp.]|nr:MAG: hypothetical protein DI527_20885 [Chelatococcus sp.]
MSGFHRRRTNAGALAMALFLSCCGAEGLSVGNIVGDGTTITFKIANDSGTTGDVVMWIEQSGLRGCEYVTALNARQSYNMRIGCPTLKSGQFTLRVVWAHVARDRALVAERIN